MFGLTPSQKEGIKLGLKDDQMLNLDFGFHTINAIKAEMTKGTDLQTAFETYRNLAPIQISAITELGLTREQVLSPNFGEYTINAIKNIQKRTPQISVIQAFEMVGGKSFFATKEFMSNYLSESKRYTSIGEIECIRVVVRSGRGFGHQRAAITLMQKLRELGFKGTFDIQCENMLIRSKLIEMIPGLESSAPLIEGINMLSELGAIKLSSLPDDYEKNPNFSLLPVDLAVCAGDDLTLLTQRKARELFNAQSYMGLEPTDWHQGHCFVADQDGILMELLSASEMRLSSRASYQQQDVASVQKSQTEKRILDIVRNKNINSQLVYGLYPKLIEDLENGGIKQTGNLDEAIEMQRIVDANLALGKKTCKPVILLLPQDIALDHSFIRKVVRGNNKVVFVDLTKTSLNLKKYTDGQVIVAFTGHLQQAVFDHLMLQGTTLPPVIEGCNSKELCESAGRPFIHGSGQHDGLRQYSVSSHGKQELHTKASLCLERGSPEYLPQLIQYMEESLKSDDELRSYHAERRLQFHNRPDACETGLQALGIKYKIVAEKESKLYGKEEEKSPSIPVEPGIRFFSLASRCKSQRGSQSGSSIYGQRWQPQ